MLEYQVKIPKPIDFVTSLMFQVCTKSYSRDNRAGQVQTRTEHCHTNFLIPYGVSTSNNRGVTKSLRFRMGDSTNLQHSWPHEIHGFQDGVIPLVLYIDTHGLTHGHAWSHSRFHEQVASRRYLPGRVRYMRMTPPRPLPRADLMRMPDTGLEYFRDTKTLLESPDTTSRCGFEVWRCVRNLQT